MRPHVLALLAVCGLALAAILLLRPNEEVRFEARLAQLEPEEALASLRAAERSEGALPQSLELAHARLARGAGELAEARAGFERVLEETGPQAGVLDELARIEALAGDMARAARLLGEAQALEPDDERRQTLGHWLRALRETEAELALLRGTPPEDLTAWERERVALLLVEAGRVEEYRAYLAAAAGAEDPAAEGAEAAPFRRQLLEFEIDAGAPDRALEAALRWHDAAPEDREGLRISVGTLIGRGAIDEAGALARRAVERDPETGAALAPVFLRSGHGGLARDLQARWLRSDPPLSREDWAALAEMAELSGDLSALNAALARPAAAEEEVPGSVFLQLLRYRGAQALVPHRARLTGDALAEAPLVAAAWSNWRRQPSETYRDLVLASRAPLTDWDREIWLSIAGDLRGTPFERALLAGAPADPGLRERLRDRVLPAIPTTAPAAPGE